MYETFYNLRAEPFRLSPDHRFCYEHKGYAKARAYMSYALMRAEGFVMITGRPGTGKTTLIGDLIESLVADNVSTANLVCTQLQADDLLKTVAFSFGVGDGGVDKAELLQRLNQLFHNWHRDGRRALLIVDEAQDLSATAMEELRLLTNIQVDGQPLLQIFLLGQPELRDLILSSPMEQVHQRIVAASHLEALELDETEAYVRHRLEAVGWRGDPALSKAIFPLIFKFSEGVPRRINLICSRLFLHGGVEQRHEIGVQDIRVVISELQNENLAAGSKFSEGDFAAKDDFEAMKLAAELSGESQASNGSCSIEGVQCDKSKMTLASEATLQQKQVSSSKTLGRTAALKQAVVDDRLPETEEQVTERASVAPQFKCLVETRSGQGKPPKLEKPLSEPPKEQEASLHQVEKGSGGIATASSVLMVVIVAMALAMGIMLAEEGLWSDWRGKLQPAIEKITAQGAATQALEPGPHQASGREVENTALSFEAGLDKREGSALEIINESVAGQTDTKEASVELSGDTPTLAEESDTLVQAPLESLAGDQPDRNNATVTSALVSVPKVDNEFPSETFSANYSDSVFGGVESAPLQDAIAMKLVAEELFLISFSFDSIDISPDFQVELDRAVTIMQQSSGVRALITGFSDGSGQEAYNLELSRKRAIAVESYLVGAGVERHRLYVDWKGSRYRSPGTKHQARYLENESRRVVLIRITSEEA